MSLASIVGHQNVVQLLRRAVARRSVPQSLLLAGPEGVGKHAVAIALAQAINCPQQADGDACGRCNTCRRIANGTFTDVIVLDKDGRASIGIEPLREKVIEQVGYRPFEGVRRIFIIDPADDLTLPTQDALLKTLEEPPPSAILMLVTAYPDTLLATIRSRCRRLRFGPLSEEEVSKILMASDPSMPADDVRRRAAASGGSVERALAVDQDEFVDDRELAYGLLQAIRKDSLPIRLKASEAFVKVDKKRRVREATSTRLGILSSFLRDLTALGAGRGDVVANVDLAAHLQDMVPSFPAPRLVAAFSAIQEAETSLGRNASAKAVADWLVVRL